MPTLGKLNFYTQQRIKERDRKKTEKGYRRKKYNSEPRDFEYFSGKF